MTQATIDDFHTDDAAEPADESAVEVSGWASDLVDAVRSNADRIERIEQHLDLDDQDQADQGERPSPAIEQPTSPGYY